ncbi:MAG TPA: helix-turn-helix transcriptional regulator [Sphingobium sp.]
MSLNHKIVTNLARASSAWGTDMPRWVRLLASACDARSQRAVADRIGKSSGYISRLISNSYEGSYGEAETLVRAAFGNEDVVCPLYGPIPLSSCVRNRRRPGPARNQAHHLYASTCPTCANNSDGGDA